MEYYEKCYANKVDKSDEMGKFFEFTNQDN